MSITSFNQAPYFDDFNIGDPKDNNKTVLDKNYLRVLFQPGFAVQTRELNQLQSILQNQIRQLGDVSLTDGQAVLGEDIPQFRNNVDYIEFLPEDGTTVDPALEDGGDTISVPAAPGFAATSLSGLVDILKLQTTITDNQTVAKILHIEEFTDAAEGTRKIRLYLAYEENAKFIARANASNTEDSEEGDDDDKANQLFFTDGLYKATSFATTNTEYTDQIGTITKVGFGFTYAIRENVYYINGSFVHVPNQDVFFRKGGEDSDTVDVIGDLIFRVTENKINSTQDPTLLDNANGSLNFSAPGADRYQIVLEPVFIDRTLTGAIKTANGGVNATNVVVESDEIGTIKRLVSMDAQGIKAEPGQDNSAVTKTLADRTAETDGNYVIQPFRISYREFFKDTSDSKFSNGVFAESKITGENAIQPFGETSVASAKEHYIVEVETSIAYVNGNRYTYPDKVQLKGSKARDARHQRKIRNEDFSIRYGHYVDITHADSPPNSSFTTTEIADIKSIRESANGVSQIHTFTGKTIGEKLANADPGSLIFELPYTGVKSVNDFEFIQTTKFTNISLQGDDGNKLIIAPADGKFLAGAVQSGDEDEYGVIDNTGKLLIPGSTDDGGDYTLETSDPGSNQDGVRLTVNTPGDHTGPFTIYAPEKVTGSSRAKIVKKRVLAFNSVAGSATSNNVESVVELDRSDLFLKKDFSNIFVTKAGEETKVTTAKFRVVDDGQRVDKYVRPTIAVRGINPNETFDLNFEFFAHDSGGQGGDYFEASSYPATIDYCDIPTYKGVSLADFIDFRVKEIKDGTGDLDGEVKQIIPRPNTIATINEMDIYLSRRDRLVITDRGNLELVEGAPSIDPVLPDAPTNSLSLYEISVPFYTCDLQDIRNQYIDNSRYTQRQIGEIDQRLQRIEYDTALSSVEKRASDRTFLNDAGTSLLFKSAFIADNFSGHAVGDTSQPDYLVAIDRVNNEARPYYKQKNFKLVRKFTTDGVTEEDKEDDVEKNVTDVYDTKAKYDFNRSDSVVDVKSQSRPNLITVQFDVEEGANVDDVFKNSITLPLQLSNDIVDVYQEIPSNNGFRLVRYKKVPTVASRLARYRGRNIIRRLNSLSSNTVAASVDGVDRDVWYLHYHPSLLLARRRVSAYPPSAGVGRWISNATDNGNEVDGGGNVHLMRVSTNGSIEGIRDGIQTVKITRTFAKTGANSSALNTETKLAQIEEVNVKTESAQNKKSKVVDGESTAEVASLWEGTTETLFEQKMLSSTISVQPFEVTTYSGNVTLSPSSDEWIDTETRPAVVINNNGAMDAIEFLQNNTDAFDGVFGTEWNSWQTTVQSVETIGQRRENSAFWRNQFGRRFGRTATIFDVNQVTTERERTGIRSTLGSDTIEQDLGERVVDTNIIPFIRSRDIGFKVTGLKPGTQHYVFFDGEDVTKYCAPSAGFIRYSETANVQTYNGQAAPDSRPTTAGGTVSGYVRTKFGSFNAYEVPLVSTMEQGDLTGVFRIPNNSDLRFRTGTKEFKITSSDTNTDTEADSIATTTYTASGLLQTKESQILSTRVPTVVETSVRQSTLTTFRTETVNRQFVFDPIAQTFLIDESDYKNGVFVSDVDLFFAEKPDFNVDVEVYMVPTQLGIPTQDIIPGSRVIKTNKDVKVSGRTPTNPSKTTIAEGGIEATNFKFEQPVHLKAGQEYAMVVFSKSPNYRVWTTILGQKDLRTQNTITTNPSVGVFLKSQNTRTWTPDQLRDLTFKLNKCKFPIGEKEFVFETKLSETEKQGVDTFDFSLININDAVVKLPGTSITHKLEFLAAGETETEEENKVYTDIKSRSNLILDESIKLTDGVENIKVTTTLSTTDEDLTPLFDMERFSLFAVSNNTINPTPTQDEKAIDLREGYVTKEISLLNPATSVRVLLDINKPAAKNVSDIRIFANFDEDRYGSSEDNDKRGNLKYVEVPLTNANGINVTEIPASAGEDNFASCEFKLVPTSSQMGGTDDNPKTSFEKMRIKVVFTNSDSTKVCRIKNFAAFALV